MVVTMSNIWIVATKHGEVGALLGAVTDPSSTHVLAIGPESLAEEGACDTAGVKWMDLGAASAEAFARAAADVLLAQEELVAFGHATPAVRAALGLVSARLGACTVSDVVKVDVVGETVRVDRTAVDGKVIELTEAQVEDRFLVQRGEGAAMLFVGDCTHGVIGGGFMYTNRDSVSLGLVATISELKESDTTIYQALADFKEHPAVAPIIRGASMVEHSGHMVSEGGFSMVPRYRFDGCLLAGDTAMLCMNLGYQVRGMDFAIASGRFAAEAACDAIDAGDVSATGMVSYMAKLEDSFVMKDLETFKTWPRTMEGWESMFADYPGMAAEVFEAMFAVNGVPQRHLKDRIAPIARKHGIFKLLKEMRGALKAL